MKQRPGSGWIDFGSSLEGRSGFLVCSRAFMSVTQFQRRNKIVAVLLQRRIERRDGIRASYIEIENRNAALNSFRFCEGFVESDDVGKSGARGRFVVGGVKRHGEV